MSTFGVCGKLKAKDGQGEALANVLLEAAESMQSLEGCESYVVSISNTDADTVWVTEVWKDEASHAASLTLESTRSIIQKGLPLIANMEGDKLRILGGKGLKST
ncbi:antibiotic biosynthesis monooxygenase [Paenibacillus sp. F411]|uniref:ABM domain-containing protein n=1 Tax=Paenibacillus algicola TaxID=2565926 RepID=A0A4P8XKN5_9BACL|nr:MULTISPECIES: putative quinol monooxygenase [Paenibacillus]MBO2942828.1 antibiotic biosynthesis monooxygenase [Paenibacillus sp. F411]QCT02978.1 hypothetical protein E6C60_2265 [Paenibacillus algicola]